MDVTLLTNMITTFFISIGIGVCGLCILQIHRSRFSRQGKAFFRVFFALVLAYLLMHLLRDSIQNFTSASPVAPLVAIRIVTYLEFLASGGMAYIISILLLYALQIGKRTNNLRIGLTAMLALHVILLTVAQFTDLYYHFNVIETAGRYSVVYERSSLYVLSNLVQILILTLDVYLLARYGKKLDRRLRSAFWFYIIVPSVSAVLQVFVPSLQFVIFATVVATVNMFYVVLTIQSEEFQKQQLEASRLDTELSMAKRIQTDMLPNVFPPYPDRTEFDIFASMKPAREVGGDFYDFFFVDEDRLAIVMADVSGKGVPAALFMMISKIIVQNFTLMNKNPKAALEEANEQICQNNREEMFVTVWLGILDLKTGILTASNAGHEKPAVKQSGKPFELLKDKNGFVIGGLPGAKYQIYETKLDKGSRIFLYTDGVAEATNAENEQFGTGRMLDALNSVPDGTPEETLTSVDEAVRSFVKDAPQFDDITMLCLQYNGPKEGETDMLTIPADIEQISNVQSFVAERLEAVDCPMKQMMQIDVAIDEIFANIAKYSGASEASVQFEFSEPDRTVVLTFADNGKPYDPLTVKDPDITLGADERPIGGLGIFIVKKTMDSMDYEYKDGLNILTIRKQI